MSLPVVLRPEAGRDVEEAQNYLDAQQPDLGKSFLDRLNDSLVQIGDHPDWYGIVWRNVHAARIRRFAYVIYYRIHVDYVEMHGSRDAPGWQLRT